MAKYTITIKTLIDNNFNFGLTSYPIFDENYRNTLNQNILNYYYESEIGVETAALFKKLLNARMQLIMPKYNKMYNVQNMFPMDNIYNNVNLTETMDKDTHDTIDRDDHGTISETNNNTQSGSGTQTGSSSANNKNLYQDTPHGSISMETLGSGNVYATNFTLDNNSQSSSVTDTSSSTNNTTLSNTSSASRDEARTGTEDYVKTLIGSNGKKYSVEIYEKLYDNVLNKFENIDMLIINELQDLFMGIY